MYKWMSMETGELGTNIWYIIRVSIENLFRYGIVNMKWKYNKNGF